MIRNQGIWGVWSMVVLMAGMSMAGKGAAAEAEGAKTPEPRPEYTIRRAAETPALDGKWEGPAWNSVPALEIAHFYQPDRHDHRPETRAKVVYDDTGLYLHFRVDDQYVRSIETEYHGKVWEDACVEFFVEPKAGRGYFNFEINCGGTMLLSYKEDPDWEGDPLRAPGRVPWELAKQVEIYHSMPETVEPEIAEPVTWNVEYHIPYDIFEAYLGDLGDLPGQTWRANFYKCAENNSHPHWASWALIEKELNFHQPEFFSEIHFEE